MIDQERLKAREQQLKKLLVSGLAGNAADYYAFLLQLSAHLRAFFRKRLSRLPNEVEDLVQETLIAVHNQRASYDADHPLTAWVHAIGKYKLIDLLRRRASREMLAGPRDDEMEFLSSVDAEAEEARRDLIKLLALLPEHQRLPIMHTKLEGLSVKETAYLLGMSESAVKVGVHRGLKALANIIRDEQCEPKT